MGMGKKYEDDQRIFDENHREAVSNTASEKTQETNTGNNEINDVNIIRSEPEIFLKDFNRLKDENKRLTEEKEKLNEEVYKNTMELRVALETKEHLNEEIKRKNEKINRLEDENKHLTEEKDAIEKKLKDKTIGNHSKKVNNLNIQKVSEKLRKDAYDHLVKIEINYKFEKKWYWIAPYEGKIRDYTQNKLEDMDIPIVREGHLKKKNIRVLVDKEARIIYIEKNRYKEYENELSIADADPIIVNNPKY